MILIGIDPGPKQSAVVHFDANERRVVGHCKCDNFDALLAFEPGKTVVCEMIQSFGMPVGAEVFQTVLWIGRFQECCRWVGSDFFSVYRQEVKSLLCHSAKANDAAIRQRVIDLVGPPGKKKEQGPTYGLSGDEWQALAVCLAFLKRNEQE